MLRKQVGAHPATTGAHPDEIPVAAVATVLVTSEAADHPIDNVFDGQRGSGGSRWVAEKSGEQAVTLVFDVPQKIRKVTIEVEEETVSRTQEVVLAVSYDGGQKYRELVRQEFNFSPPGTTFEREEWTVPGEPVTHLRLWIKPDKGGRMCRATLTSLALQ
ncbi:MAG TPA: hypothetical protein VGJ57_09475 [Nitrospirales bacterium]|jgi:hypothetical protein